MDDVTREIRQMLLGNLETRGKYLAVSANKFTGVRYGMTDGADRILLLGVMRHTKYFTSELNNHKIKDAAHKSMMDIGRKVILDSNPNVRWKETLEHAEKIGLGTREYELIRLK